MRLPDPESELLLRDLESCRLPHFTHDQHVRVAWHLLRRVGLVETLRRLPSVLRAYATSKGHAEVYHETITFAFVCLVHERLAAGDPDEPWPRFRDRHRDLFDRQLLTRYYPKHVLQSPQARQTFLLPRMLASHD